MKLALLYHLAAGDFLTRLTWHFISQYHDARKIGNQVVVEAETKLVDAVATRLMCCDMTDYSGQGRSDLADMQEFFSILVEIHNPVLDEIYYDDTDAFTWMWKQVNEAVRKEEK